MKIPRIVSNVAALGAIAAKVALEGADPSTPDLPELPPNPADHYKNLAIQPDDIDFEIVAPIDGTDTVGVGPSTWTSTVNALGSFFSLPGASAMPLSPHHTYSSGSASRKSSSPIISEIDANGKTITFNTPRSVTPNSKTKGKPRQPAKIRNMRRKGKRKGTTNSETPSLNSEQEDILIIFASAVV